ncbi:MAG TPA: FHA domain-containing protein [Blastocatellia bacterium]|nr:FHA domain-containing protein [Blastocatellia bacterium]
MDDQVTGQAIIEELIYNMQQGIEPLVYAALVPSLYNVYLHPEDYDRLSPIFHIITVEAQMALDEEVRKLNKKTGWLKQKKNVQAVSRWIIKFHKDMDEEVRRGEILIDSQLGMPQRQELAGTETKIIKTLRSADGVSKTIPAPPTQRVYATIVYEDDRGRRVFKMTKPEIVIGRGGKEYLTDLKLYTSPDVSREHLRIRYDAATNQFFARDVSTLGTSVNGIPIPSSVEIIDGNKHDKHIEVPIPPRARLILADVLILDFDATGR